MAFLPLGNSDLVVSVSIDFPLNSVVDVSFHCTAFDYSLADSASLWDQLGAVLWGICSNAVFLLLLLICRGLFQVENDVYILYCKYQVKPH